MSPSRLPHNVTVIDARLRRVFGTLLLLLAFLSNSTSLSFLMILGSLMLLGTGLTRFCPVYEGIRILLRRR